MRRIVTAGLVLALLGANLGALLGASGAGAEPGDGCGSGSHKVAEDPEGLALCSHGPDPLKDAQGELTFPPDLGSAPEATPCLGDGTSGYRIEVIYGVPADVPNNYEGSVEAIREAVAFADAYFEQSDVATSQHLRLLCDPDGQVTVHNFTLAPIGDDGLYTFFDMYSSLTAGKGRGKKASKFISKDRIYVTFVDGIQHAYPFCGQATRDPDDSASPRNKNNTGPAYSLIACWTGTTTLHEIGHNLGAVQESAPHSSGAGHCYDEHDVMCYDDGGPYFLGPDGEKGTDDDRTVEEACGDLVRLPNEPDRQFDCNLDDYYHPNPPLGGYLVTHWNLANSNWVER